MSRLSQVQDAARRGLHARAYLTGASGSGKTLFALRMASILAQGAPVLGIDTEDREMLIYSPLPDREPEANQFRFQHLSWNPPYDPRELGSVLHEAAKDFAVVVVDSSTHFWKKSGGTLSIADGDVRGWKEARPAQEVFVEAVHRAPVHIIATARSKMDYAIEVVDGRTKVRRVGMAPEQDATLDYEFNLTVDFDLETHAAQVTKSRMLTMPPGTSFGVDAHEDLCTRYQEFLAIGEPPASVADLERVRAVLRALTPEQTAWAQAAAVKRGLPTLTRATKSQLVEFEALAIEAQAEVGA